MEGKCKLRKLALISYHLKPSCALLAKISICSHDTFQSRPTVWCMKESPWNVSLICFLKANLEEWRERERKEKKGKWGGRRENLRTWVVWEVPSCLKLPPQLMDKGIISYLQGKKIQEHDTLYHYSEKHPNELYNPEIIVLQRGIAFNTP